MCEPAASVSVLQLTNSLCDEGSAFWIGRLAIRSLLRTADRSLSTGIYSSPASEILPLHADLLAYFGATDPMSLIDLVSLNGGDESTGETVARRNAYMAGAARIVFRWAFDDAPLDTGLPSPPDSAHGATDSATEGLVSASRAEAMRLARSGVVPLIELAMSLLGDGTVVKPESTALALGGGLMMAEGYRKLLLEGLRREGVEFAKVVMVADAAGEGAKGLANVEFGSSA